MTKAIKYETLFKGLMAKREKLLKASSPEWYEREKNRLTTALFELEERKSKSQSSNEGELKSVNVMIEELIKLMPGANETVAVIHLPTEKGLTLDPSLVPLRTDPNAPPPDFLNVNRHKEQQ